MNQPNYTCPECGNTSTFTELVWEQRRYPIDHHGETISVSEAVEDTEVPIQISCADCGAVISQREVSCFVAGFHIASDRQKSQARKSVRNISPVKAKPCPRQTIEGCSGSLILIPDLLVKGDRFATDVESQIEYATHVSITKAVVAECTRCTFREMVAFEQTILSLEEFIAWSILPSCVSRS